MAEVNNIDAIRTFMKEVTRKHKAGNVTELSYRSDLERLLTVIGADIVRPINEAKSSKIGKPDITMMHKDNIPIGYLEAKNVGISIRDFKGANKKQFDRYTENLDNLIYTNNLDWDFYRHGKKIDSISIGELDKNKQIVPNSKTFGKLVDYLLDFAAQNPQSIKTAGVLTEHMARRTRMIRYTLEKTMIGKDRIESLQGEYSTIVDELIKGLSKNEFTDMYAQTITYGLLAARLKTDNSKDFNRQELQNLLPKGYPFLNKLLLFIATEDLGGEMDFSINDLIALYQAVDVEKVMNPNKKIHKDEYEDEDKNQDEDEYEDEDPFLHFYEDFLNKYNSSERKSKGAYYTPKPVVDFIVRAVDWVLKEKFNMPDGLASTEKIKDTELKNMDANELDPIHKVQILDPATGTGAFLAQTIRQIEKHVKIASEGNWSHYVDNELLPRLNGFEIMIAPYAISYLKLDRELEKTEYEPTDDKPKRLNIFLTNSLAKPKKKIADRSYDRWFVNEAQGAKDIKDNKPIMCVIGNPPYLGESKNKDPWIMKLLEDYKKEPGTDKKLNERTSKWLNDDYVKFLRMAQHMVDNDSASGEGVVGMITNHKYLENVTFRGMRWHLMNTFDEIYILNLHGDNLKETGANVFDGIKQGVSIIIAWRKKRKEDENKPLAQVFRGDLTNTLDEKHDFLNTQNLNSDKFEKLDPRAPEYFFKPVDYTLRTEYNEGFKITAFMPENGSGIITKRDPLTIHRTRAEVQQVLDDFLDLTEQEVRDKYNLPDDVRDWRYEWAKADIVKNAKTAKIVDIAYRPFDTHKIYYSGKTRGLIGWPVEQIARHFLSKDNIGLAVCRQQKNYTGFFHALVHDKIIESSYISNKTSEIGYSIPLYVYLDKDNPESKCPNMDETIYKSIEACVGNTKLNEMQIFDYIYGLLHAPEYRTRYAKFLKTDFPIIPYPKDSDEFWHLSSVGKTLRELHLMKYEFDPAAYPFKGTGKNIIKTGTKFPRWENNKIFINDSQFFDNVPEHAWDFRIGSYQSAQKWLKDRRGETLDSDSIKHYQRIIAVLVKTYETMDEIVWTRG